MCVVILVFETTEILFNGNTVQRTEKSIQINKKIYNFIFNYNEFSKILLLSETYGRLIEDRHASSETHRRPTCPIGDRHALLETDIPDRRPKCLIGDQQVSSET